MVRGMRSETSTDQIGCYIHGLASTCHGLILGGICVIEVTNLGVHAQKYCGGEHNYMRILTMRCLEKRIYK